MSSAFDIDEAGLTATTPATIGGDVMLDVRSMMSTNPPKILLTVDPPGDERPTQEYVLSLGDTFPIDDETWRFEDVDFYDSDRWTVLLRRVKPGSPPFEPPPLVGSRVWIEVELRPFGTADETQIADLEHDLGRRLPQVYRRWLAETNGAAPAQSVQIRGSNVVLTPHHPLLGIRPDLPHADLRRGETLRQEWLSESYIVIAEPLGGLLVVGVEPGNLDEIFHLTRHAMREASAYQKFGYGTRQEYLTRDRLVYLTTGIYSFCADLYPMPPLPPAYSDADLATGDSDPSA
jgi:hypothetical protein